MKISIFTLSLLKDSIFLKIKSYPDTVKEGKNTSEVIA